MLQSNDLDSDKKFPSKSCPLRYGIAKIQEDALNLFQAGLREYLGSCKVKTQGNQCSGWSITALSVSASKIVAIPTVSLKLFGFYYSIALQCFLDSIVNTFLVFLVQV